MNLKQLLIAAILACCVVLQAPAAFAQATRTWVSGVGDDVNPCSRTAPCRTFAGAILKTASGGEINTLDPGAYGTLTIAKSISIVSDHKAGMLSTFGNGVVINTPPGSKVVLDGLDIEGAGTGLNGVRMAGSGRVTIRNSTIRNFTENGIFAAGQDGAQIFVENVFITGLADGVRVDAAAGGNDAFISRSVIEGNTRGVSVIGAPNSVTLADNVMDNGTDLVVKSGAAAISFGGNAMRGAPTKTLPRR